MICVEVHSNNVLTVRDNTFSNAVSDSIKHETVKFLYSDNWKDYQKTAVFTADGLDPINIVLDRQNPLCIAEDECYIPFEVLKGDSFTVSVFGVKGERLATTTEVQVQVLESGYALGDAPQEPTADQYSQVIDIMTATASIAQSVRADADAGVFNGKDGEKGEKGDKGDKGDKGADGVGRSTQAGGEVFNACEDDAAAKNAHAEGNSCRADGNSAHAEGNQTVASGDLGSHAEGLQCVASGNSAHAEGQVTTASGVAAHTEGTKTKATADQAHAEGISSSAKGKYSHAEGYGTAALGVASHSEGGQASAWGKYSHAGGNVTNAYADYSVATGDNTRSDYVGQTAVGRFNSKPLADSVFTVGNGTSVTDRKNAFNVYADGHAVLGKMGTTENSVATKNYVDSAVSKYNILSVVDDFPDFGVENVIYLLPNTESGTNNLFDEYVYANGKWELIGSKTVDLSDYYTKQQVDTFVDDMLYRLNNIAEVVYQVGSMYLTQDPSMNPGDILGGTWERKNVIKTVAGKTRIYGFEANKNKTTSLGDISYYRFKSLDGISLTPISSSATNIKASCGSVTTSGGYVTDFSIITNSGITSEFYVYWTITGNAEYDENGYYHWVRVA